MKADTIHPPKSSQVIRIAVVESDQKVFVSDIDRSNFNSFEDILLGTTAKQIADEIDRLILELQLNR